MQKPIRGLLYLATKALIILMAWRVKLMGKKVNVGDVLFATYKNYQVVIAITPEKGEQPEDVTNDTIQYMPKAVDYKQ